MGQVVRCIGPSYSTTCKIPDSQNDEDTTFCVFAIVQIKTSQCPVVTIPECRYVPLFPGTQISAVFNTFSKTCTPVYKTSGKSFTGDVRISNGAS